MSGNFAVHGYCLPFVSYYGYVLQLACVIEDSCCLPPFGCHVL